MGQKSGTLPDFFKIGLRRGLRVDKNAAAAAVTDVTEDLPIAQRSVRLAEPAKQEVFSSLLL